MKKVLAVFGVAAACAACCTVPVAMPLIAGLTASGLGWTLSGWQAAGALLLATGLLGLWIARSNRQRARASLAERQGQCACPPRPADAQSIGGRQ